MARSAACDSSRRELQKDPASPSRVLVISGADRNDGSCPGEMSKTYRLSRIVIRALQKAKIECDECACRIRRSPDSGRDRRDKQINSLLNSAHRASASATNGACSATMRPSIAAGRP
jgi:hypothetical protein